MAVTRTIYLPTEQDINLYNKAKSVAKENETSVSNFMLEALNHYMNNKNGIDFPLYILYIGNSNQFHKKKFHGLYLTSEIIRTESSGKEEEVQVYLTKKGNVVVYQVIRELLTSYETSNYHIYESIEEVKKINENLYQIARSKLDLKEADLLDV
ncbi:hypothetical protein [Virgibacillus halodenitrificans]|uniref:hypothetical protein n=1 Tax=Virgibacillus halodenitrificans TaxID=1482 RepID=UPI000EF4C3D1|nr:hypothetical protein [Virgibacillus halodenitrificans]